MAEDGGSGIIVKACLNGGRSRDDNPHVPWTPQEVADEAGRCPESGAAVVHLPARGRGAGAGLAAGSAHGADRAPRAWRRAEESEAKRAGPAGAAGRATRETQGSRKE